MYCGGCIVEVKRSNLFYTTTESWSNNVVAINAIEQKALKTFWLNHYFYSWSGGTLNFQSCQFHQKYMGEPKHRKGRIMALYIFVNRWRGIRLIPPNPRNYRGSTVYNTNLQCTWCRPGGCQPQRSCRPAGTCSRGTPAISSIYSSCSRGPPVISSIYSSCSRGTPAISSIYSSSSRVPPVISSIYSNSSRGNPASKYHIPFIIHHQGTSKSKNQLTTSDLSLITRPTLHLHTSHLRTSII